MLEEIRFYEAKMEELDSNLETIDNLEVELRVMAEIKERDEQLIRYSCHYLETWLGR